MGDKMSSAKLGSVYENEYLPYIYKWGMITNTLALILGFLPALTLYFGFGIKPTLPMIAAGVASQLFMGTTLVSWIVDPIAMYPLLGMPGMFMSFLSGNISNLRLPALVAAQGAAEVEPGTEEGNIIGTLGIAVSVVVGLLFVTVTVLGGSVIISKLPENVMTTLNYILPSLFGAIFVQFAMKNLKLGAIALTIAVGLTYLGTIGVFDFLPIHYSTVVVLSAVFGTIAIGRAMVMREIAQEEKTK